MNYRHAYHAGNFADVFKHVVLVALIRALQRKETGFCYLDTHAGAGQYNLLSDFSLKTKEFETGIAKVITQPNPPALIKDYLTCISSTSCYPGSPSFAHQLLRPQDKMILCELHEEEHYTLKNLFAFEKQMAIHKQDAYQALKAFLPPKEKRGLVLIDPPYEKPDEYEQLVTHLPNAVTHWSSGVYALWYPIKERRASERFLAKLKHKISRPLLIAELSVYPENIATHFNGSGMFIVNPPWQLDQELQLVLPWLWQVLSEKKQGRYLVHPC